MTIALALLLDVAPLEQTPFSNMVPLVLQFLRMEKGVSEILLYLHGHARKYLLPFLGIKHQATVLAMGTAKLDLSWATVIWITKICNVMLHGLPSHFIHFYFFFPLLFHCFYFNYHMKIQSGSRNFSFH